MITIPAALQSYLLSGLPFWVADLYTVTLFDGVTVYYWSTFNIDIIANGHTYTRNGPGFSRSKMSRKNTSVVPEMEIKVIADNVSFGGGNFKLVLHNGLLDGARIHVDRAYMPIPDNVSLGTAPIFEGRNSDTTITATGAVLKVKGDNVLFNQFMPKNLYQIGCIHTTYDNGCTLLQSANTNSNTVGASPTKTFIPWGSLPANPTFYAPSGILKMTSGVASGQFRNIKAATSAGLTLGYPLYNLPSAGDTFTAAQGDDKTLLTCKTHFSPGDNSQHWRAFPFIPPAETAL